MKPQMMPSERKMIFFFVQLERQVNWKNEVKVKLPPVADTERHKEKRENIKFQLNICPCRVRVWVHLLTHLVQWDH